MCVKFKYVVQKIGITVMSHKFKEAHDNVI